MASKPFFLSLLTLFTLSSLGELLWTSNNLYGRQSAAKKDTSAVEIVDPSDSGGVRLGQRKARQQIRLDLEALKRRINIEPNF